MALNRTRITLTALFLSIILGATWIPTSHLTGEASSTQDSKMICLYYNCRNTPLDDPALRAAISYTIDRELITGNLTDFTLNKLRNFLPNSMTGWVDDSSYLHFNLEDAWNALEVAGYDIDNSTGVRKDPNTNAPMKTLNLYTRPYWEDPAQWMAGETVFYYSTLMMIPIRHLTMDGGNLTKMAMNTRDFDMLITNVTLSDPPLELYDILSSSQDKPGTSAYSGIHDAQLDEALESLKTGSIANQKAACISVQKRLFELVPYAPIYTPRGQETKVSFTFDTVGILSGSNFYVAVAFDYVEILDNAKQVIARYDMGTSDTTFGRTGSGFTGDYANSGGVATYVWAGGDDRLAELYLIQTSGAAYLRFNLRPLLEDNPVHIYVDDIEVANLTLTLGWAQYTVPLNTVSQQKLASGLTCIVSKSESTSGEEVTITGKLTPQAGTTISLSVTAPSGHVSSFNLRTTADGAYTYSFKPLDKGTWRAQATWPGDDNYLNSQSDEVSWQVVEANTTPQPPQSPSSGGVPGFGYLAIVIGIIASMVILQLTTSRKQPNRRIMSAS